MDNLENLPVEELKKRLLELEDYLEEIEEERQAVLSQTGLHLPGHTVRKYEAEIESIKKKIATVKEYIKKSN
ncbi:MAG: hypothetical protein PHT78_12330 [Desulfitobacteriaceae bacterium]|nr:hypothetical protein [Desulfitobacteriaceae bacterium]MDD4754008.1 hypothetical protein [Desulfitobacteriaceae bacterium]